MVQFIAPPVMKFGSEKLKQRIMPDILAGKKRICLAITEPDAGSDVANLTTEAKLSEDGKYYIVTGEKKWITNGIWADYFTTAVRTGGPGAGGVSLLLIERTMEGIDTRQMDCQGVLSSGTTFVSFDEVKVPVENLIGKENQGFRVIMTNFNHERLGIIIQANRASRVCYEESFKYAQKRETFGKKLVDHPVIRLKLANMARQIEATHNWMENMVYQCQMMGSEQAMLLVGGAIAGLKAQATVTMEFCAREAAQIFGGLSYTKGGRGEKVERLYREVRNIYIYIYTNDQYILFLFLKCNTNSRCVLMQFLVAVKRSCWICLLGKDNVWQRLLEQNFEVFCRLKKRAYI